MRLTLVMVWASCFGRNHCEGIGIGGDYMQCLRRMFFASVCAVHVCP
jgi:hypothetical protein